MKRILIMPLINLISVFLVINAAYAIPMIYTFQGTLPTYSIHDGAGIISDAGLAAGSKVSYNILLDFDRPGSYTLNDGTIHTYPMTVDTGVAGIMYNYYAQYIGGSALQERNGGIHNSPSDVASYNRLSARNCFDEEGRFYLNSDDNPLTILGFRSPLLWVIGERLDLRYNTAFDSDGNSSYINGVSRNSLTLTDISPYDPIPEPSTMLLLGFGLAGLAGLRMRREIKK